MDLVADDHRVVTRGDLGELDEVARRVHRSGGIVRIAQQHGTGAVRERAVDAGKIEPPAAGVATVARTVRGALAARVAVARRQQGHRGDLASGLFHAHRERRVHRRRDDDAVTRPGRGAQQLDDAHHDVGGPAHARRVDPPPEASLRVADERAGEARVGGRVPGVADRDGLGEHRRDRGREGVVGLGHEHRQHVGGIGAPLGARAAAQDLQRQCFQGGVAHPASLSGAADTGRRRRQRERHRGRRRSRRRDPGRRAPDR